MQGLDRVADALRAVPPRVYLLAGVGLAAVTLVVLMPGRDFLDPGQPDFLPDVLPPSEVPVSVLATPVTIPLRTLVGMMEEAVPRSYGDVTQRTVLPDRDRTDIAFELDRAPFQVTMNGNVATLRSTIQYAVRVYYDPPILPEITGSCGTGDEELKPRLTVTIRAPITIDERWRLRTAARVVDVSPASQDDRDHCRMTFLGIDVTGRILDAARGFLENHTNRIDDLAAGVDLESPFEGWWNTLQEPISLADSLWLVIRPEAVQKGSVQAEGGALAVALGLRARPMLALGARPDLPPVALPPLDTGSVDEGLDLRLEARIDYLAASEFLREMLAGRSFEHDGRVVQLDSLRAFGIGGGRLAVEVLISGDVSARLFLVGTPEVESATGRIFVPDLDFDVSTRNVVLAAASWLRAEELRDLLREQARFPAEPAVEWLSTWLAEGLNRDLSDDLRVEGEVESVRILSVHALRETLLVRTSALGTARLFVRR